LPGGPLQRAPPDRRPPPGALAAWAAGRARGRGTRTGAVHANGRFSAPPSVSPSQPPVPHRDLATRERTSITPEIELKRAAVEPVRGAPALASIHDIAALTPTRR
jgi:hypothetical protein